MDAFTLTVGKANSCDFTIAFKDLDGSPLSITGAGITFAAKECVSDADPTVLKRSTAAGGNDGEVTAYPDTQSAVVHLTVDDLPKAGEYVCGITVTWSATRAITWPGTLYVSEHV